MKVDDNWRETHILAEDLDILLGLPSKSSENYLGILSDLTIHKFLEEVLNDDNPKGKDYQITLPYMGDLIISIDENNNISTSFAIRNIFYKKIKQAYKTRESPLVETCANILGQDLIKKYEEGEEDDE